MGMMQADRRASIIPAFVARLPQRQPETRVIHRPLRETMSFSHSSLLFIRHLSCQQIMGEGLIRLLERRMVPPVAAMVMTEMTVITIHVHKKRARLGCKKHTQREYRCFPVSHVHGIISFRRPDAFPCQLPTRAAQPLRTHRIFLL